MTDSRLQLVWEAKVDLHDGKACPICGTPARVKGLLVGPAPNPVREGRGGRYESDREKS